MSERGHYGNALSAPSTGGTQTSSMQEPDYGELGIVLGIGVVIGTLIGSNITFHTPIKKRRK